MNTIRDHSWRRIRQYFLMLIGTGCLLARGGEVVGNLNYQVDHQEWPFKTLRSGKAQRPSSWGNLSAVFWHEPQTEPAQIGNYREFHAGEISGGIRLSIARVRFDFTDDNRPLVKLEAFVENQSNKPLVYSAMAGVCPMDFVIVTPSGQAWRLGYFFTGHEWLYGEPGMALAPQLAGAYAVQLEIRGQNYQPGSHVVYGLFRHLDPDDDTVTEAFSGSASVLLSADQAAALNAMLVKSQDRRANASAALDSPEVNLRWIETKLLEKYGEIPDGWYPGWKPDVLSPIKPNGAVVDGSSVRGTAVVKTDNAVEAEIADSSGKNPKLLLICLALLTVSASAIVYRALRRGKPPT
ncbi:MAG: hypothetical protein HC841_08175 [Verrucomicrobiae bacterium]|nr:hypothetical protein [Verrucomicrobiae bacterium]